MNASIENKLKELDQTRLFQLVQQRRKLQSENGLAFYKPHEKQVKFHASADFKYRYVRTGNRWGKSQCGAAEDVSWCLGERVFFPEGDPRRYVGIPKRPVKGVVFVYDWGKADEIFTNQNEGASKGKIFQFLPKKDFVGVDKDSKGEICTIYIKSKWGGISSLHFDTVKSFMQNPMAHESSNWDFIHVDEPCPRDMWVAASRGLMDSGGKAWFLCTPLDQMWINDFFVPSRRIAVDKDHGSSFIDKRWVMIGSSSDNPYVSDEDRKDFADTLSKEEAECRLHGIPTALAGTVYKEFRPEEHCWNESTPPQGWKDMCTPPKNYTIRYAIDPHPKTPHAVLFAATAPTGEVFFYNEVFKACLISDLADSILEVTGDNHVELALCDPLAYIESPVDGTSMADVLFDKGLELVKAPKDLQRGIHETKQALRTKMPTNGQPILRFMPGVTETLWEFDHYVWDQKKPNHVVDKDDHMMENLYRLIISGLHYVTPPNPNDQKVYPQYVVKDMVFNAGRDYTDDFASTANNSYEQTTLGL